MTTIALLDKHYDKTHLEEVKTIMQVKGAPVIRCIWSDFHGLWLAIEGCHRLRAALALGLTPIIKDVSNQKTVNIQNDGEIKKEKISALIVELNENTPDTTILDFKSEEDQ